MYMTLKINKIVTMDNPQETKIPLQGALRTALGTNTPLVEKIAPT